MTTANNDTASASAGTPAALRALAVEPSQPLIHLLHADDEQAALLRKLIPSSPVLILEHLPVLFPSIVIEYVDTIPVAGISFWVTAAGASISEQASQWTSKSSRPCTN